MLLVFSKLTEGAAGSQLFFGKPPLHFTYGKASSTYKLIALSMIYFQKLRRDHQGKCLGLWCLRFCHLRGKDYEQPSYRAAI